MTSAKMLLEEYPDDVDMFKVTAEGVEQLCMLGSEENPLISQRQDSGGWT